MSRKPLNGLKVLVPRPWGSTTATRIESLGGTAIQFPVIEISEPEDFSSLDESLRQLANVDLIILVSVPAATGFFRRLKQLKISVPQELKVAAIGPKTAALCECSGIEVDFVPDQRTDSEGLLDCMNGFDMTQKHAVIYRGQSGRELLKTGLEAQGAKVTYVESYRRNTTTESILPIVCQWSRGEIDVVLITSVSVLDSLVTLLGNRHLALLKGTTVVALSARLADQCVAAGIEEVLVSAHASDEGMMEKLLSVADR
jgi:uroporphyrinogen-III synthase